MEPKNAPRCTFDWLVLTAASARQAEGYGRRLSQRSGGDATDATGAAARRVRRAFAVPDAHDTRIGSGAATVLALAEVARRILDRKRARSIAELFAGERILILHSGGDSRRLPTHAVEGKIFAPIPKSRYAGSCATVLDLLLEDLASLAPREGGEVLVGAGDAVLGLARNPVRFEGPGVIGVAQWASAERASRHGVFVRGEGDVVDAFLQKPTAQELRASNACGRDGRALVDLGLFSFDPASIERLFAAAGVRLRAGKIAIARGGLAARAARAELPPIDLYREIAMALPGKATRARYLETCAGGSRESALAKPLGAFFDAMRGTPFRVQTADLGDFLHIGSMTEMLAAFCGPQPAIARFGVEPGSMPLPAAKVTSSVGPVLLDSRVAQAHVASGGAVIDASAIGSARLGGNNIVCCVVAKRLELPRDVALFRMTFRDMQRSIRAVHVACGIGDDFKTRFDAGGTLFGQSLDVFLQRARIEANDVVAGDGTLWDARLWVSDRLERRAGEKQDRDLHADVEWMWLGQPAPADWRRAKRWSLREIVARGESSLRDHLRARNVGGLHVSDPGVALACAAKDGNLRELFGQLLRSTQAERRAILANEAKQPVRTIAEPVARAHALAMMSCVAASLGRGAVRSAREYRAAAFAAVGETVLSRLELPSEPARAAILHDQAVWTSMPVRVDLAGGWTDTPPICNALGGAVVNVAVTLRGQLPVQVVAKLEDEPVIRITSTDLGETRVIRSAKDLALRGDPTRWSSLAENALLLTGAAPADPKASLRRWLDAIGGGISLTLFSAVPKGSGLGTSSILGAATIHALDRVFGRERTHGDLFAATSALEQMLGSRGGWQDQVGGVVGGFKIARTAPGPEQRPSVEPIAVPDACVRELAARSLLYFTGERRMAKNILENVVWNYLTLDGNAAVSAHLLRENAERMRGALSTGDVEAVLAELDFYRTRKRDIDPGSCPPAFEELASRWSRELSSWCFAGAGGGGFMLLVARDADSAQHLARTIEREKPHSRARSFALEVDAGGLRCAVL